MLKPTFLNPARLPIDAVTHLMREATLTEARIDELELLRAAIKAYPDPEQLAHVLDARRERLHRKSQEVELWIAIRTGGGGRYWSEVPTDEEIEEWEAGESQADLEQSA